MPVSKTFWYLVSTGSFTYAHMLDEKDAKRYARTLLKRYPGVIVFVATMFGEDPVPRETKAYD